MQPEKKMPSVGALGVAELSRITCAWAAIPSMQGRQAMSEIIIAEWPVNSRETMRVRLDTYQGSNIIDLRRWYAAGDGTLKPGRGGLTIAIRHLPALASALAKVMETANATGFIPGDGPQNE